MLAARKIEGGVRRITPFLQVGETLVEELHLRSLHWWPKLLLEADHRTKPFGSSGRVVTLWPYQTTTWTVEKHCERRGVYEYGEIEVTARDPLGLFTRSVRLGKPETALVYPATFDLPGFFVPAGQGFTEGANEGRTFMPSPVAGGIREYVPGDGMGHIHWPATARARKLMVKLFDREPSGPFDAVWVLLDLHSDVQAGSGTESTVEYGVTVAASILKRFIDGGMPVGLTVAGEEQLTFKPASGVTQLGRILEALALIQPGRAASLTEMAAATAEGLDYAHHQGVIHRDIKPANLLYNPKDGSIKISDFGVARMTDNNKTKTGIVLGTPMYMSPEQLGAEDLTGLSDLFSLGVTLYELLVGEVPFKASNIAVLMAKITTDDPAPVSSRRAGLPPSVDAVLAKALAKKPHDRFSCGAEMAIALRNCAGVS